MKRQELAESSHQGKFLAKTCPLIARLIAGTFGKYLKKNLEKHTYHVAEYYIGS